MTGSLEQDCPLCWLAIPHPVDKRIIAGGSSWTVAVNDDQAFLGRCFFALNRHETDVTKLSKADIDELWRHFGRIKAALDELFAPDHYNYVFLMNVQPHLHAHIIPRYKNERYFAGQTFKDGRLGEHYDCNASHVLDIDVLAQLAGTIRSAYFSSH